MSIKPILFNTDMVCAILEHRKTVTRRVVKEPYYIDNEESSRISGLAIHRGTNMTDGMPYPDSPYRPGDILYVRETWAPWTDLFDEFPQYIYRADYTKESLRMDDDTGEIGSDFPACVKWCPYIHMPREAARIFLRVTDVRVERLQDID